MNTNKLKDSVNNGGLHRILIKQTLKEDVSLFRILALQQSGKKLRFVLILSFFLIKEKEHKIIQI